MFPLYDENPTVRLPVATLLLLAAMGCVWWFVQGAGMEVRQLATSICNLGLVPGELTGLARLGTGVPIAPGLTCVVDDLPINWLTPVIAMFLHGDWMHLITNAVFFWVFGNNIEDMLGIGRFMVFFLVCGLAAAAAQVLVTPASPVPMIGASGAVSGILGAYLISFPRVRVRMYFPPIFFLKLPAWLVLIYWFVLQLLAGLPQLERVEQDLGGVAVWAHVGGFVAGALLVRAFQVPELVERRRAILLQRGLLRATE